jgi:hypothetical protein
MMQTKLFETFGPCAVFISTTSAAAFDYETRSRFIILTIDESSLQTARILSAQRLSTTFDGRTRRQEKERIVKRMQNLQRLLKPIEVVNPYAKYLEYPTYRLQTRRDQGKYLGLIEIITLLHQYQRPHKQGSKGEYIETDLADIALANKLAKEVLVRSSDEMAPHTRKFLEDMDALVEQKLKDKTVGAIPCNRPEQKEKCSFDRIEIVKKTNWSIWQARQHLNELIELGYINIVSGKNGQRYAYQLAYNGELEKEITLLLIEPEELKRRMENG